MSITLIGGGSRSGKSSFGLTYARNRGQRLAFIATAQAFDAEMGERIAKHQSDRGRDFITFEEPAAVADLIGKINTSFDAILVDCLTLWLSNLLLAGCTHLNEELEKLISISSHSAATIVFITNEVGCGIVPENALARRFRDEAGRLNQMVAAASIDVYWMVFGLPLHIKQKEPQ